MAAYIRLVVGSWQAQVDAANDDAVIALLTDYEAYYEGELDPTLAPAVRLKNMLEHLVRHVQTVALAQRQTAAQQAAIEAADADAPKWAG